MALKDFTKRTIVCPLLHTDEVLIASLKQPGVYSARTKNGWELRSANSQPLLATYSKSIEELKKAISQPELGYRYCNCHPKNADNSANTNVVLRVIVAPNEGFELIAEWFVPV